MAGLGWRTVERAKAELGVIAEPVGKSDGRRGVDHWCWRPAEKSAKQKVATLPTKLAPSIWPCAARVSEPREY